jgi:glycosyltransferase involved in cell wall biosynthesis
MIFNGLEISTEAQVRVSLVLFAYNQRRWLEDAIVACFNQKCEKIEIILSDDASVDGSYELMLDLAARYKGGHIVKVRKNETNLGIGEHYNRVIKECLGELIVTAAGDDISLPNRVEELLSAWDESDQKADLIASHVRDMTLEGELLGIKCVSDLSKWDTPEKWTKKRPYVIGASHAFTKRLHDYFGPFLSELSYEDQVMAFRASCLGGGVTVKKALINYRRGGLSAKKIHSTNLEAYKYQIYLKNYRQLTVFSQIKSDMNLIGLGHLWTGKVEAYYSKANFMLKILQESNYRKILQMALEDKTNGKFWTLKEALRHIWRQRGVRKEIKI